MKVVTNKVATWLYPFLAPNDEARSDTPAICVLWNGAIQLYYCNTVFDTAAARKLAQALLHATEIAEKGRE